MVAVRAAGDAFRQEFPMARVAYVIENDLSTLDEALDQLLGEDPLAEQRRAYRSHCLGDWLGPHAADEFLRVAGEIVAAKDRRRRGSSPEPQAVSPEPLEDVLFAEDPDVADPAEDKAVLPARLREGPGEVACSFG